MRIKLCILAAFIGLTLCLFGWLIEEALSSPAVPTQRQSAEKKSQGGVMTLPKPVPEIEKLKFLLGT